MAMPSKKTPELLATIAKLAGEGLSTRQIAKRIGTITHTTVANYLEEMTDQVRGGPPPVHIGAASEAQDGPVAAPVDIVDREGAVAVVRERLGVVQARLKAIGASGDHSSSVTSSYVQLSKLETELASRLVELAPPPPVDPERDPLNIDAAGAVREKLGRLVLAAEAEHREQVAALRCVGCGCDPRTGARR